MDIDIHRYSLMAPTGVGPESLMNRLLRQRHIRQCKTLSNVSAYIDYDICNRSIIDTS